MAAQGVEWLTSQRGRDKLILDGYEFVFSGKGKRPNPLNVCYWVCTSSGCGIKVKTEGNVFNGVAMAHVHVNSSQRVADLKLKVRL